jgi:hypothetical protein
LRFLGLGNADLWGDEAFSVMTSLGPPSKLLQILATAEPHPPLYPFLLVGWLRLFGSSEFAARLPSAFAGIATVAAAAALAKAFAPRSDQRRAAVAALVGGLLVAVSPFQVWYSQEARMYAQVSFFATLATLALLRLWQGRRWSVPLYALAVVGASGSHYYGLFIPVAHGLAVLVSARHQRAALVRWVRAVAIAAVLYLPWVFVASRVFTVYDSGVTESDLPQLALSAWARVIAGWSASWSEAITTAAILSAIAAFGLLVPARSDLDRFARTVLGFWLVTPFVGGYAVSFVRPLFNERYLVVCSVPFFLLAARGIVWLLTPRLAAKEKSSTPSAAAFGSLAAGVVVLLVVALAVTPSLRNFWSGAYVQSTYDTQVKTMDLFARPGDAVILNGPPQEPLYRYYARKALPYVTLPRKIPLDPAATTAELSQATQNHRGVWVFWYAAGLWDPTNLIGQWLGEHGYLALDTYATNARLQYYRLPSDAELTQHPTDLTFGNALHLDGYALTSGPLGAGDTIPVDLHWRRQANTPNDVRVALRLVDDRGFTWAQVDQNAVVGGPTTAAALPAPSGGDRHGLMVPLGVPPGSYLLQLDVYSAAHGQLAPSGVGATVDPGGVRLATIQVSAASRSIWANGIAGLKEIDAPAGGGLKLLGYSLGDKAQAGTSSNLSLVWQATASAVPAAQLRVFLLNGSGMAVEQRDLPLATKDYPVQTWRAGDVLWEQYRLPVSDQLAAGTYRVAIQPVSADSSGTTPLVVGSLAVDPPAQPATTTARPSQPLAFDLDQKISLQGYDLSPTNARPGDTLNLTLYWNDRAPVDGDYTVFVHVLDASEKVVAQKDQPPGGGTRPTSSWFPGDTIVDHYSLTLPPTLPPGDYPIEVGMYNATDGTRLPVTQDGKPAGDRIIVTSLHVSS